MQCPADQVVKKSIPYMMHFNTCLIKACVCVHTGHLHTCINICALSFSQD